MNPLVYQAKVSFGVWVNFGQRVCCALKVPRETLQPRLAPISNGLFYLLFLWLCSSASVGPLVQGRDMQSDKLLTKDPKCLCCSTFPDTARQLPPPLLPLPKCKCIRNHRLACGRRSSLHGSLAPRVNCSSSGGSFYSPTPARTRTGPIPEIHHYNQTLHVNDIVPSAQMYQTPPHSSDKPCSYAHGV